MTRLLPFLLLFIATPTIAQTTANIVSSGGSSYVVFDPEGNVVSSHNTQHKATEMAVLRSANDAGKTYYVRQHLELRVRVKVPSQPVDPPVDPPTEPEEPEPPVDPEEPEVPPVDPEPPIDPTDPDDPESPELNDDPYPQPFIEGRVRASDFELIGGYRIRGAFSRGGLAIDFAQQKLYVGGHAQAHEVWQFQLEEMGLGSNVNDWPILERLPALERFWGRGYANTFEVRDGVLWTSPRVFYDMDPGLLTLYGLNLETGEVIERPTELSQPAFGGGFIKGRQQWLIGCGGYESGQGSMSGPTAATIDSDILLNQHNHGTMVWEQRTLRPANYYILNKKGGKLIDNWIGMNPRVNSEGQLEGRWCADKVHSGGHWLPNGLCYFPLLGEGELRYDRQSEAFASEPNRQSWLYSYDPETFDRESLQYERWPHGHIRGTEVDEDGLIYMFIRNGWKGGMYHADPLIKVFRVKE